MDKPSLTDRVEGSSLGELAQKEGTDGQSPMGVWAMTGLIAGLLVLACGLLAAPVSTVFEPDAAVGDTYLDAPRYLPDGGDGVLLGIAPTGSRLQLYEDRSAESAERIDLRLVGESVVDGSGESESGARGFSLVFPTDELRMSSEDRHRFWLRYDVADESGNEQTTWRRLRLRSFDEQIADPFENTYLYADRARLRGQIQKHDALTPMTIDDIVSHLEFGNSTATSADETQEFSARIWPVEQATDERGQQYFTMGLLVRALQFDRPGRAADGFLVEQELVVESEMPVLRTRGGDEWSTQVALEPTAQGLSLFDFRLHPVEGELPAQKVVVRLQEASETSGDVDENDEDAAVVDTWMETELSTPEMLFGPPAVTDEVESLWLSFPSVRLPVHPMRHDDFEQAEQPGSILHNNPLFVDFSEAGQDAADVGSPGAMAVTRNFSHQSSMVLEEAGDGFSTVIDVDGRQTGLGRVHILTDRGRMVRGFVYADSVDDIIDPELLGRTDGDQRRLVQSAFEQLWADTVPISTIDTGRDFDDYSFSLSDDQSTLQLRQHVHLETWRATAGFGLLGLALLILLVASMRLTDWRALKGDVREIVKQNFKLPSLIAPVVTVGLGIVAGNPIWIRGSQIGETPTFTLTVGLLVVAPLLFVAFCTALFKVLSAPDSTRAVWSWNCVGLAMVFGAAAFFASFESRQALALVVVAAAVVCGLMIAERVVGFGRESDGEIFQSAAVFTYLAPFVVVMATFIAF